MSEKNPTLREAMAALRYREGQEKDPRVLRFIMRQSGPRWQLVQKLLRKKARRR